MKPPPIRIGQLTIAASFILIILLTLTAALEMFASGQNSDTELRQDIAKLDSFLSDSNLDSFEAIVDKESAKWQGRDRRSFVIYMFKACSLISSYAIGDISKRATILSRYAMSVLSGDLPLEEHVGFVEFLMLDPPKIDEAAWRTLRKQKAELWLAARRSVESSIDPTVDLNDWPQLNVPTPRGSRMPNGVSPESIKDPRLRAEYEQSIAENSAKARKLNKAYWLNRNAPDFYKNAERYLVNAYARQPADPAELERLLSQYIDDNGVRVRILEQVRKSSQQQGSPHP